MLLAYFRTHLTKTATYGVAKGISLNLNLALNVKISKDWVLVNTCLNWLTGHLASRVRKLDSSTLRMGFVKLDLPNFLSFLPILLTTSLLSTPEVGRAQARWGLVFNIEVSRAAIFLKS